MLLIEIFTNSFLQVSEEQLTDRGKLSNLLLMLPELLETLLNFGPKSLLSTFYKIDYQFLGKNFKNCLIEDKASILVHKDARLSRKEIIDRFGRNMTTIIHLLAALKKPASNCITEKKKDYGRPRKVPDDVLKILKR